MVDLITYRIIDLLPSRDSKDVKQWLSTFPNIELVARDGACILRSLADSDAFQSGRCAAHNGRPETLAIIN